MSQMMHNRNAVEEQQRAAEASARRRRDRENKAYDKAHPEDADLAGWLTIIGIVLVALVMLWAYYGPIIRDAIYGA